MIIYERLRLWPYIYIYICRIIDFRLTTSSAQSSTRIRSTLRLHNDSTCNG